MQHLAAYSASNAAGAIDADTPAVPDAAITISNNHFVFTTDFLIKGAYALGAALARAKIQTPKFRQTSNPYIRPIEIGAAPPTRPNFADYRLGPLKANRIDETAMLLSNSSGVAEREFALIWVDDGQTQHPQGDIYCVRGTAAVATVANVWALGALTLDQTLPAGRYSVVGMSSWGAGLLAARLVFPLQVWRPGVIAMPTEGLWTWDYFARGAFGELGQFESIAQPQVEFLATVAGAAQEVYLDLIRVR